MKSEKALRAEIMDKIQTQFNISRSSSKQRRYLYTEWSNTTPQTRTVSVGKKLKKDVFVVSFTFEQTK